jgi:alpha-tubulin suppressor-like RCC1 family protein
VVCWGRNSEGQLGDGTTTQTTTPVATTGLTAVTDLTAGDFHSCAVQGGAVQCWGYGGNGRLGAGSTATATVPTAVAGLTGVATVEGGAASTCAVLTDATSRCWGYNALGQLGTGGGATLVPAAVSGLTGAVQITAGQSYTLRHPRRCQWAVLGDQPLRSARPLPRDRRTAIAHLDAGTAPATNNGQHTCARLTDGTATCWGAAGSGELGDGGDYSDRLTTNRPVVQEG